MSLPVDYDERVYAGVLGKIIGVYLGRPLEITGDEAGGQGWTYEQIMQSLGEVTAYCHEPLGEPLIVVDDDISGTFAFLRALEDSEAGKTVTSAEIAQGWLNYLIEGRTVLWWEGCGISTEHTAYLRLRQGVSAPRSGSMAVNGKTVAEQIGAQIFIDGWAMVAPGDPALAAELARRAASVSHDGEAVFAAQMIAAMESAAFVEPRVDTLLDAGLSSIPRGCELRRMIADLRAWRRDIPDWRDARRLLEREYGYQKYDGNCPVLPNHGVIILGLLYGEDSFQRTLSIVNTCGWDTDCNSGNAGCLMGIKNGLEGIEEEGTDWRTPVADRMYVSTADGGETITDALRESQRIVRMGRALAGEIPQPPKEGARFHFDLPGAVQGFSCTKTGDLPNVAELRNVSGHSCCGTRSLEIEYAKLGPGCCACISTPTFSLAEDIPTRCDYYDLVACPTIYSGQTMRARVVADIDNPAPVVLHLFAGVGRDDEAHRVCSPAVKLDPGDERLFSWRVPETGGYPIIEVGMEMHSEIPSWGKVYLDFLTWDGVPSTRLVPEAPCGRFWSRAWVDATDRPRRPWWPEGLRLVQNQGQGMLIQGTRDWDEYRFEAEIRPLIPSTFGVAARVRGLRRYYAMLCYPDGKVCLVKCWDGHEDVMAMTTYTVSAAERYRLRIEAAGQRFRGYVNDDLVLEAIDQNVLWIGGAAALLCREGAIDAADVWIHPVHDESG